MVLASLAAGYSEPLPGIKKNCKTCHILSKEGTAVTLRLPVQELCVECHMDRKPPGEHPSGIPPTMAVRYLPLDRNGNVTCVTCHEPHGLTGKVKLLRANPGEICGFCHDK